jgi:hypothetical protein
MASKQKRIAYLREHLHYELLMLRFTWSRLKRVRVRLLWNALYESFGVHARNLIDFLRNEQDSRNFKASDFIEKFEVAKKNKVDGVMQRMHQQLLHLGKQRTTDEDGEAKKINMVDVEKIGDWIETGLAQFTRELSEPYREHWQPDRMDSTEYSKLRIPVAGPPSQSSLPGFLATGMGSPKKEEG